MTESLFKLLAQPAVNREPQAGHRAKGTPCVLAG